MKLRITSFVLFIAVLTFITASENLSSFIEVKNVLKTSNLGGSKFKTEVASEEQEKEKSQLTLKDLLVASMGSKRKTRFTEENLKCAHVFQANNKSYFDCTLDRAPDGQIPTKEWCYLEKNPHSDKTWDYCKPDMNYDKIRTKVQSIIKTLTDKSREMQAKCDKVSPDEAALVGEFKSLVLVQSDLTSKVSSLHDEAEAAKASLQYLLSASDEWERTESKSVAFAQQIERELEKIKILKEEAKAAREKEEKAEIKATKYSPEQIKQEAEMSKIQIADWIQEKQPSLTKDCQGMLNYEEEPMGIGLVGKYFNNPRFSGGFKQRIDPVINFELTGTPPMNGINIQNYSIQWDGYIQAPFRSKFYFNVETEGGAEVYLSGKQIISLRMFSSLSESQDRANKLLDETIKKINDPTSNNNNKKTSEGITLTGGDKYIIRIKYYHSIHDYLDEDGRVYFKLTWHTDEIEEEVIEKKFLFPENNYPSFKISGLSPDIGVIRKLLENDLAFKDSKNFILQDIPTEYQGLTALKLPMTYKGASLEFNINVPMNIFIAKQEHYPRAFPANFENLNQFMSLLEVDEPPEKYKSKLSFEASASSLMRIYKKKFEIGKVKIPLAQTGLSAKGNPLVIFFGVDNSSSSPMSCGGNVHWISQPGSSHYDSCTASSQYNANHSCSAGLDGTMDGKQGHVWATNNEGIGAYMMIKFKNLYEVHKIKYRDRINPGEQNSKLEFEFSTGDTYTYDHVQSSAEVFIDFDKPFRTYWVKVTIKGVFGTINNGGAFKIFGTSCTPQLVAEEGKNVVKIQPLFNLEVEKIYNINCMESISNSKKLFNVNKSPGYCAKIQCFDSCYDSLLATIYGDTNYSKDSAICKSAVHAGVLSTDGGKLQICFGARSANLPAMKKNGIQSKSKDETDLTINFKPLIEEAKLEIKVGAKFDLMDIKYRYWEPAIITEIIRVPIIGTQLAKYKIESKQSTFHLPAIPMIKNPLVASCGAKIKGRDCKGTKTEEIKKVNIRFGPSSYNSKGDFKLDDGQLFGHQGRPYGWSRVMTENMKTINTRGQRLDWNDYQNIIESYVEFPPSKKSKYCSSPMIDCDEATYTIKTGDGLFMVRLFIDIQESNTLADFQVNGKNFAKNKPIPMGQRAILEGTVDSINGDLVITTNCSDNCLFSMSRLNMIQVFPYADKDKDTPDTEVIEEGALCGGTVKRGKDCEKGEDDVLHCVFQDERSKGASMCTGSMIKTKFPTVYDKCPAVAGMTFCIQKKYTSDKKCKEHCPGRCEKDGMFAICLGN